MMASGIKNYDYKKKKKKRTMITAGHCWLLTSVILAIQGAVIRRVRGQPRQQK
jgi:hypothetical protein